ncbi:hypothetical protein V8E52_003870 [Russula decolorans]
MPYFAFWLSFLPQLRPSHVRDVKPKALSVVELFLWRQYSMRCMANALANGTIRHFRIVLPSGRRLPTTLPALIPYASRPQSPSSLGIPLSPSRHTLLEGTFMHV